MRGRQHPRPEAQPQRAALGLLHLDASASIDRRSTNCCRPPCYYDARIDARVKGSTNCYLLNPTQPEFRTSSLQFHMESNQYCATDPKFPGCSSTQTSPVGTPSAHLRVNAGMAVANSKRLVNLLYPLHKPARSFHQHVDQY